MDGAKGESKKNDVLNLSNNFFQKMKMYSDNKLIRITINIT